MENNAKEILFDLISNGFSDFNDVISISIFFSDNNKEKSFFKEVENDLQKMGFIFTKSLYNHFGVSYKYKCKLKFITIKSYTFGYKCDYAICDKDIIEDLKDIMIKTSILGENKDNFFEVKF